MGEWTSWTTCIATAKRFACDTYEDSDNGVVVKTIADKLDIIHYDKHKELEAVVKFDSVRNSKCTTL